MQSNKLPFTAGRALAILIALSLFSCAPPRREWQPQAGATATTGGGQTVAASGVVAHGSPAEQLQQLDGVLTEQGFAAREPVVRAQLMTNGIVAYAIFAVPGQCYTVAVMGESPEQNIDIILLDPYGRQAGHDVRPDNHPWVSFCASQGGRFIARIQMVAGDGMYSYAAYQGPANRQMELSAFFGQQPATVSGGVQENFALLDADMRARGYVSYGEQTTADLTQGSSRAFEIQLEGGICYAILAVGDTPVTDLDLRLVDQGGIEVDRDTGTDARPTVRVCPSRSGQFSMQVEMAAGSGSYIYAPYRWPRGTSGPFGLEGVSWVRLSEVTALLSVEGFEPDPGFTPGHGELRQQGASANHQVELSQGQCYAVVAVGGEGIIDLDIAVSLGGAQLNNDAGNHNAFPSVRQCVEQAGSYTITVTAAAGAGSYHYQIFSRSDSE